MSALVAAIAAALLWLAPAEAQQPTPPGAKPVPGSQPAPAPLVNLAKGKRATQSSDGWGGKAAFAIDGNRNPNMQTGKSVSHTADKDPMPWLEIDLGAVYKVTAVRIFNRGDCCAERIQGAVVIVSDQPLPKPNGMAAQRKRVFPIQGVRPVYDFPTGGAPVRFVRVQMQKPGYLHMAEVEVIGEAKPLAGPIAGTPGTPPGQPPQQLVNLAKGKRATQSSDGWGGKAAFAIDGNRNPNMPAGKSVSHTADKDPMPWLEIDLGAVYKVTAVRIFNRGDCCAERIQSAVVIVSDQPLPKPNGMTAQRKRVFPIQGVRPVYDFPTGGMPVRFVRVQMQKPVPLHLAEVEVMGEPKPMQPPAPPKTQ